MKIKLLLLISFSLTFSLGYTQNKSGCSGNCENGYGTYIWGDDSSTPGAKYSGQWKDGEFHGLGVYELSNGNKYDGDWIRGKRHGQGKYYYANGEIYDGNWVNGLRHGQGRFEFNSGSIYIGTWKNGIREGKGKMIYKNKDIYEGEWKNGKEDGAGKYFWKSGDRFEGQFRDGLREGPGKMFYNDGTEKSGVWKADVYQENTSTQTQESSTGCVSGDCENGKGKYIFEGGESYEGDWKNGKYEGEGKYIFSNGDSYNGEWKNSLFDGFGTYRYSDGEEKKGYWKNNKYIGLQLPAKYIICTPSKGNFTKEKSQIPVTIETKKENTYISFIWSKGLHIVVELTNSKNQKIEFDLFKGNTISLEAKEIYKGTIKNVNGTGNWEANLFDNEPKKDN
jgi:hypothetical protein